MRDLCKKDQHTEIWEITIKAIERIASTHGQCGKHYIICNDNSVLPAWAMAALTGCWRQGNVMFVSHRVSKAPVVSKFTASERGPRRRSWQLRETRTNDDIFFSV